MEVPHPIAAGNRLEGWDCQGSIRVYVNRRVAPVLVVLPAHRALTGLPWRATSSVAGEAPVPVQAWLVLLAAGRPATTLMRAG